MNMEFVNRLHVSDANLDGLGLEIIRFRNSFQLKKSEDKFQLNGEFKQI